MEFPETNKPHTHTPIFPTCPGEKINFNGMIYCVVQPPAHNVARTEAGLCAHCFHLSDCSWKQERKFFCEHYQ